MPRWPAWMLALLMAGCAGDAPLDTPCVDCADDPLLDGTRDLRTDLRANDTLPAPKWEVGDVFEQHMFFGRGDTEGRHIKTVVVDDAGGYLIATPDEEAARFEATYDYPILGRIGTGLETTFFGSDWSWMYDFPLTDGKTWKGSVEELLNWNSYTFTSFDLRLEATFDTKIPTPTGQRPGFWIEVTTTDGEVLMRYNYVPTVGWFSHLWIYDLETPEDDVMFHAMSMGTSQDYTGAYLLSTANTVLERWFGFFPDPSEPISGDPPAPQTFDVGADARLMGIAVPIAVAGRTEVHVVEPDGRDHSYAYEQRGMEGDAFDVHFIDLPGKEGDWVWAVAGAGAATGSYTWLNRVTTTERTLG